MSIGVPSIFLEPGWPGMRWRPPVDLWSPGQQPPWRLVGAGWLIDVWLDSQAGYAAAEQADAERHEHETQHCGRDDAVEQVACLEYTCPHHPRPDKQQCPPEAECS